MTGLEFHGDYDECRYDASMKCMMIMMNGDMMLVYHDDSTREMVNVGENRARNGVTDCPESRNEENFQSMELLDSSRYATERLMILRDETFSSNHYSEAIRSHGWHQGSYLQVLIVVLPSELRLIRNCFSIIINNINYLMTIKAMSLTLNVQKDSIRKECFQKKKCFQVENVLRQKSCERTGRSPVKEQAEVL
ncbi:hypothetical protein E3N88_22582 [Mikania micrantha]|uniref:Uncharacterized protein n=1 Tax=Mikania micrantha TaxID=192012 RepID=A0A5N6NAV8_9ASTR|nr:hypothetical protein E3N88_22582 [Mikania micrantha]